MDTMRKRRRVSITVLAAIFLSSFACTAPEAPPAASSEETISTEPSPQKIRLIIDSDANNELDDQFALTYALHNSEMFDLEGITVNRTRGGGGIDAHYAEAERVIKLSGRTDVPLFKGASGSFRDIAPAVHESAFDGKEAVDFIIARAHAQDNRPLVLAPVGKLTNIALALEKDPSIASNIRIVWLGSHWPKPGEYNLENDTTAVNPVIASGAPFEMALVRWAEYSGTAAVLLTLEEVKERLPGLGPHIDEPIVGRHGGEFNNFGDYGVDLFVKMGDPQRALFDMAALAIIKNPDWAQRVEIEALDGEQPAETFERSICRHAEC